MSPKISIIIVNYNTSEFIEKSLNSIFLNLKNIEFEVIVVDNNSPDKSIRDFPSRFPDCSFYFLKQNRGFGAGCNYGVEKSRGEYILFLNPDVELINSDVIDLVSFMDENSDVALNSGLMTDYSGNISYCYNYFPDLSWEFSQATGFRLMKKIYTLIDYSSKAKHNFEVDWFHGAFLLVRKNIFEEINGFDENFFLYYEDVDLQKKIKSLNYKIFCLPKVRIRHFTRGSVRSSDGQKIYTYNMHMSKLYYMNKYFNTGHIFLVRLFYLFGSFLKIAQLPFRRKYRDEFLINLKNNMLVIKIYLTKYNITKI